MGGAISPMTTDSYENGVVWARARHGEAAPAPADRLDQRRKLSELHARRGVRHDHDDLIPGAYDLYYQRAYQSSAQYVSEQQRTPYVDPVVNGYRRIAECVLVP